MSVPIDTKEIIDPSLITTPPATPVESGSLSGREVKQQEKIQETIESVRKSLEIVKEKELSSQETFTINLYKSYQISNILRLKMDLYIQKKSLIIPTRWMDLKMGRLPLKGMWNFSLKTAKCLLIP